MTRTIAYLILFVGMVQNVLSFTPVGQSKNEIHKVKAVRVEDDDNNNVNDSKGSFISSRREMMQKVIGTTATGTLVIGSHAKMANALVSSINILTFVR